MDIKSKNNHRLGLLILLLIAAAGTACIMALYPWLRQQAFEGAVNITMGAAVTGEWSGYGAEIGDQYYVFSDTWRVDALVFWIASAAFTLTAILAFVVGLNRSFGLTRRRLFSMPFELLAAVGYCAAALLNEFFGDIQSLVWHTVTGELRTELVEELYMGYGPAGAFVAMLNVTVWFGSLLFICWLVVSAQSVFTLGLKRWFKERTLTGRLLLWGGRMVRQTCALIETIDFREDSTKRLLKIVGANFLLLSVISCFWFFGIFGLLVYSVILFFLLRRIYSNLQGKYQIILDAAGKMAQGDLDVEIEGELGIFEPLRGEITKIRNGFKKAVDEEVRSRSMKTELITNVSHDLKTPLTAIITYVNLLKKDDATEEEKKEYIRILDQKSMRLKRLIEDLFEISRANSNNATLNLVEADVVSLMKQVRLELDDKIRGSEIDFRFHLPDERVLLLLDSEKTYRVFENLLVNIVKYAMPGTRAYVEIREEKETAMISFKNISAVEITLSGEDITERFVRGDTSRNTEGSGLGLAIARSFTELMGGAMDVSIEADLFKVRLVFPRKRASEAEEWD